MSGGKSSLCRDILNSPVPNDYDNFATPPVHRLKKEDLEMPFLEYYRKFVAPLMENYPLVILRPEDFTSEIQDFSKLQNVKVTPKIQHVTMKDSGVGFVEQWDEKETTLEKFWKAQKHNSEFLGDQSDKLYFSKQLLKVKYVNDIEYLNLNVTNTFDMDKNLGLDKFGVMSGINQSWGYAGTAGSCSPLHNEDQNLASLNHHEGGADKIWYGIQYEDTQNLTNKIAEILPNQFKNCPNFLRHKSIVVDPGKVNRWGIDVWKVIQKKGDYVVTGPGCLHQIFNKERNFCRAVNLLPPGPRALKVVQEAKNCSCELGLNKLSLPISHSSEKLYKCLNSSCKKVFDTPFGVKRHLEKCIHGIQIVTVGDIPPVMCPYCAELYKRVDPHIKTVHSKEIPDSVCSLCRIKTSDLNKHFVTCRECKFCKATFFKSRQQAMDHLCTFST